MNHHKHLYTDRDKSFHGMTRRGSCYCDFQCAMKDVGGEILLGALFIEKELVKRWMLD